MRKIKFRGKRVDNGKWVYGYYEELVDSEGHFYWINEPNGDITDVIPETVGQYTGLKDKNGVEIYEGDVLTNSNGRIRTKVEFVLGGFGYRDNAGFFHPFAWETDENGVPISLRVIGNIHDNPELMGEE